MAAIITEDLGKIFEKALCQLAITQYNGNFKYSPEKVNALVARIQPLRSRLTGFVHTGNSSNLHDFEHSTFKAAISAKTVKKGGQWKICPQIIGQTTKARFAGRYGISSEVSAIKSFVLGNLLKLLDDYVENTFHCDLAFYCEAEDKLLWIVKKTPIVWKLSELFFTHERENKKWNESTTLKLAKDGKELSVGEFQIHNHRDGVKFRFNLKALLEAYPSAFHVSAF